MKSWNKICAAVLFLFVFYAHADAQNDFSVKLNYNTFLTKNKLNTADTALHFIAPSKTYFNPYIITPQFAANFGTECYGFFCWQELKIEKATHIPFRFRLGSLEQCNYYEGKN